MLDSSSSYDNHITALHLARLLPRLAITSRIRGSKRMLRIPPTYARKVMKSIMEESTGVIGGESAWPAAVSLAQPYLEHLDPSDPLLTVFTPQREPDIPPPSFPDAVDGRRLSRLSTAISRSSCLHPSAQQNVSSLHHQATPAELLSLIAPQLLRTLSTAPTPPIGIPSNLNPTAESQASAWAGKVYSSHEFRDRERVGEKENTGLGIAAGLARGVGVPVGGGVGVGGGARPASRHVDEYA